MKKLFFTLLCAVLILTGCANNVAVNSDDNATYDPEEKEEITYTSKIAKEECSLCSKAGQTLLPAYAGQNNVGINCINTFDMSPVTIKHYEDHGDLIEKTAGYMSMTSYSFGADGIFMSVSAYLDRGDADSHVHFNS